MLCKSEGRELSVWRCGVVVSARDEEDAIEECLKSLRGQTVKLFLVVVNDGSVDKTSDVASGYADVVVDLPRHEESWTGRPELARVINAGFDVLRKRNVSYVLMSGADAVYPPNYVEEITYRMENERIVLASGVAKDDVSRTSSPRGCGRVVDAKWFRSVSFRYPENYSFEGYLVYKALSQGEKVAVFPDLKFRLSRRTRLSRRKLYLWGKGMKALNYWWPYAIGRIIIMGLRRPQNGFEMLKGYLSYAPKYEDVRCFIRNYQVKTFLNRIKEVIRHF
jgi:glycosyltransferase involved in cell wall biosynthesis